MHFLGCSSFFIYFEMCYIQNCITIGENSRKILSAQHYDFQWGIFESPVPRPESSLMHRPKSALTCWFSSVHRRQLYYTGISPRQRQNDALRFHWHRSLIACAVGSAQKGAGRNDIRSILCKGLRKLCKTPGYSNWRQGLSLPTFHDLTSPRALWAAASGEPLSIGPGSGWGTVDPSGGARAQHHSCCVERLMTPRNAMRSLHFTFKAVNMCVCDC